MRHRRKFELTVASLGDFHSVARGTVDADDENGLEMKFVIKKL